MADLWGRIERAGRAVDPGWTGDDVERTVQGVRRKQRRRRVRRALQGAAVAGLGLGVFLLWPVQKAPVMEAGVVRLGDGSRATPLDPGTELAAVKDAASEAIVDLRRGRGRFEVVHREGRVFAVRAGEVTITVLGTAFTVERVADRIGVAVERGTVRVSWADGERRLGEGESGWFPPLARGRMEVTPSTSTSTSTTPERAVTERAVTERAGQRVVVRGAAELLAAADGARAAGRLDEAAALLERVIRQHERDPRAPLAAFTLGRLLLTELARPAEAAAAFARARALAPEGALAEDALAREVEAWAKVPDRGRARARAEEYLRLFPAGRRAEAVRASGLE